jgi:uncharacterized protein (TIGR02118 family)
MNKVSIMYPNTTGAHFDHAYYRDKHMPLITTSAIRGHVGETGSRAATVNPSS